VVSTLKTYALPVLGPLPVDTVSTDDVMRTLQPIWHTKTETAARVRQRIEAVLDYAGSRGWRGATANPARWKGHLAHLLPPKHRVAPVQHHKAMPWAEVPAFMVKLAARQGQAPRALAFGILTGVRSSEFRAARVREFDLSAKVPVWTVPGVRMKGKQPHRVPLAPAAINLVRKRVEKGAADDLVFPGAVDGKPLSDVALAKLLPPGTTVHGFRSALRTWAGECTPFAREVIEHALAHRVGDAVEQAYARGDLFTKRAELMTAWAEHCAGPTARLS
jgi:integrase